GDAVLAQAEAIQGVHRQRHDLRVGQRTGGADQLDATLGELAVAAFGGTLVAGDGPAGGDPPGGARRGGGPPGAGGPGRGGRGAGRPPRGRGRAYGWEMLPGRAWRRCSWAAPNRGTSPRR